MKSFVCNVSQELINIFNYHPSNLTQRYKAQRNGLPIVLQVTSLTPELQNKFLGHLTKLSLCQGVLESDFNLAVQNINEVIGNVLIENADDKIVYRSRNCEQMVSEGSTLCQTCSELLELEEGEVKIEETLNDIDCDTYLEKDLWNMKEDIKNSKDITQKYDPGVIDTSQTTVISIVKKEEESEKKDMTKVKCSICSKILSCSSSLRGHMRLHSSYEECGYCRKPYMNQSKLQNHILKRHSNHCKFCDETFERRKELKRHLLKVHNLDNVASSDNKNVVPSEQCPFCEKMFIARERFVYHVKHDHIAEKDNPIYIEFIKEKQEYITCDQCGEEFTNKVSLTKHTIRSHKQFTNPESCDICGKLFNDKTTLESHKLTHEFRQSLCMVCGASFKSGQSLIRHMDVVHGEGYKCPDCGKKFTVKARLQLHIKTEHLGEKVHCPKCNKSFRMKSEVKKHLLTVHDQVKPWYCDHCPFRCARYGNLNIHKQKSHQIMKNMPIKDFLQMIEDGRHPNCVKMEIDPDLYGLLS